ncbi:hypothetical protein OG800_30485 [Streptomyces sp. NBC_00445]|uniref:hypothetical protein n=1 Tax=Streptomyces sp. NBC_00445 TaxID=2975745 RepID=UPI002E1E25A0
MTGPCQEWVIMPLFRKAQWPRDHRDEFVAGALVGAVVIVLGYASGIGPSSVPGAVEAAAPPPSPPAATAPPSGTTPAPGDSVPGVPGSEAPVGGGVVPVPGGSGAHAGHDSGAGHTGDGSGHDHTASPGPGTTPSPSPSPSGSAPTEPPQGDDTCQNGEVRLVAPVLTGLTEPLFGLFNGTDEGTGNETDDKTPEPSASPCVGLVTPTGLLGTSGTGTGLFGITNASPPPEATP